MARTRLTGVFATIVAVLIAAVAATALYTSVKFAEAEKSARIAIQDATAYSSALDRLKDTVLDAETGQRGYMLTGDRDYLQPYLRAKRLIEGFEDEGWEIAAMRGGEDEELRKLVTNKLTELDETIRLFDAGSPQAALTIIQTDRGQEMMAEIRQMVRGRQAEANEQAEIARSRVENYNERSGLVSKLLALLLVLASVMGVFTLFQWFRMRRVEEEVEEAVDTAERIEVIAHELDHRMKNLFAVAQGMLRQSARGRGEAVKDFAEEATSRLRAMSHAYSATRELDEARSLSKSVIIDRVVRSQLLDQHRVDIQGDDGDVTDKAVSPLALILHEWTTNALKYGAWKPDADPNGPSDVRISWRTTEGGDYELLWDEQHERRENSIPEASGYGSKLIKACAAQLGGKVDYDWHDAGVRIRLIADTRLLSVSRGSLSGAKIP